MGWQLNVDTELMFQKQLTLLPVLVTSDCCSESQVLLCCSVVTGGGIRQSAGAQMRNRPGAAPGRALVRDGSSP